MANPADDNDVAAVLEGIIRKLEQMHPSNTCEYEGCAWKKNSRRWCIKHSGGKPATICSYEGCKKELLSRDPNGRCYKHLDKKPCQAIGCKLFSLRKRDRYCEHHVATEPGMVFAKRIKRESALRAKHFDAVYERQGGMCTDPMRGCYAVEDGEAVSRCPFLKLDEPIPKDMAELDHVVPLCEGGSDDPDNLQVLCACCHAAKSRFEAAWRKPKPKKKEEVPAADESD